MGKEATAVLIVLALLGCVAAPASASDVLAHWAFDEGAGQVAADTTSQANDGRLGATVGNDAADPGWIAGADGGSALRFNGDQYVTVPDTPVLEPAHVAVDAWVRRSGSPGRWRYVLSKGSVSCDRSAYGLYSGWTGGMSFYVSSTSHYTISPEVPASQVWDGQWHHIVGSYDGQSVRLFIDGAQVGDGTPTTLSIAYGVGSKGVYLGSYRGSCSLGFRGDIDDLEVWDDLPPQAVLPLPVVTPVPGTPTQVAVPDAHQPSSQSSATEAMPSRGTARGCLRVSLSRRTLPLHKRTLVIATVRRGLQRVAGVRVVLNGAGVTAGGKTNHKGKAGIRVRARKRGHLTVRVRGQKASCATQTIRAR
jgi:concanavalin A-like lectin/glucanase superfamily protein